MTIGSNPGGLRADKGPMMINARTIGGGIFVMGAVGICVVLAQPAGSALEPIVAGDGDEMHLSDSLRMAPADLRLGTGFDQLYRLPREGGDMFARVDGGLTAVFPRSNYLFTPYGAVPTVPADTVWVIGQPEPWLAEQQGLITTQAAPETAPPPSPYRVDMRAGAARPGQAPAPIIDLPLTMATDFSSTRPDARDRSRAELVRAARDGVLGVSAAEDEPIEALLQSPTDATPWGSRDERAAGIRALLTKAADAYRAGEDGGSSAESPIDAG